MQYNNNSVYIHHARILIYYVRAYYIYRSKSVAIIKNNNKKTFSNFFIFSKSYCLKLYIACDCCEHLVWIVDSILFCMFCLVSYRELWDGSQQLKIFNSKNNQNIFFEFPLCHLSIVQFHELN